MARCVRAWVWVLVASMCCAAVAAARPSGRAFTPPGRHVFAGVSGGVGINAYQRLTGKHPPVFEIFMTWNTPTQWLASRVNTARVRLALHMGTAPGYGKAGVISPLGIAVGRSDGFLVRMNHNLAFSKRIVYVRIMSEMNGYWNAYAAYNANGSYRGIQNSPTNYIQAWRRTVLILRGGRVARINRLLRNQGLPKIKAHLHGLKKLPSPKVAFLWVPQDAGSPDIPQNAAWHFWPGRDYADWVGTDFYSSYPNFGQLSGFFNEFPQRPFVISEWAVYGSDAPGFVRGVFGWQRARPRVRMLNYYQGFTSAGTANPYHYPASDAALHQELRAPLYLAYAPEYSHPPGGVGQHQAAEASLPMPPTPGAPPGPPPGACLAPPRGCIPGP